MKRRSKGLRILAAAAGCLILAGLAAGIGAVLGGPISRGISRSKAERYLAETYPGETLEFEITHEMGGLFRYRCDVQSTASEDTRFHLTLEKLQVIDDDYDSWVGSEKTTQERLSALLTADMEEALENVRICGAFEQITASYGVVVGTAGWTMEPPFQDQFTPEMRYDKHNITLPTLLQVTIGTEDATEAQLIEVLQTLKARMTEKELRVDYYTVHLKAPGDAGYDITALQQNSCGISEFPASEIRAEGMAEALSAHRLAQEAEIEAWYAAGN